MKTVFIYDQCDDQPLSFFVVEGDFSHLNNYYLNSANITESFEVELNKILFKDGGEFGYRYPMLDHFPLEAYSPDTKIVTVGFIP